MRLAHCVTNCSETDYSPAHGGMERMTKTPTRKRIILADHRLWVDGEAEPEGKPLQPAQAAVLAALLTRRKVHWMQGLLLLPKWRTRLWDTDCRSRFSPIASKAGGELKQCLRSTSLRAESRGTSFWQLGRVGVFTSNVEEALEVLESVAGAFCSGKEDEAWARVREVFQAVRDPDVIDRDCLISTLQHAQAPPRAGLDLGSFRDQLRNLISGHYEALAEAITMTLCLAYEERLGVTGKVAEVFIRRWVERLGQAGEILCLIDGTSRGAVSTAAEEIREFADMANDYRALLRDSPPKSPGWDVELDPEQRALLEQLCRHSFVCKATCITADGFKDQPHQRITPDDVTSQVENAIHHFIAGHPCRFLPTKNLLTQAIKFLRSYVRAYRKGTDFPRLFAVEGPEQLVRDIVATLDQVVDVAAVEAALHTIAKLVPWPTIQGGRLYAHDATHAALTRDSRQGLTDCLRGDGLDTYVARQLRERPARSPLFSGVEHITGMSVPLLAADGCDSDDFLPPQRSYVIHAPSGAGKSTLLRHMQYRTLNIKGWLAVYVRAVELMGLRSPTVESLASILSGSACDHSPPAMACDALASAATNGRLMVLVDQVEELHNAAQGVTGLLDKIEPLVRQICFVVAARPTEAYWFS